MDSKVTTRFAARPETNLIRVRAINPKSSYKSIASCFSIRMSGEPDTKRSTMSALEQLKKVTVIVADTGDFEGEYFRGILLRPHPEPPPGKQQKNRVSYQCSAPLGYVLDVTQR